MPAFSFQSDRPFAIITDLEDTQVNEFFTINRNVFDGTQACLNPKTASLLHSKEVGSALITLGCNGASWTFVIPNLFVGRRDTTPVDVFKGLCVLALHNIWGVRSEARTILTSISGIEFKELAGWLENL